MAPQIDVTEVTLDPIVAGEPFLVARRLETVNTFGERTETVQYYKAIGSIQPTGNNSLTREEAYQVMAKTIRVVTKFMLRGPAKGPPPPVLTQYDYDPDIVIWRGNNYVVSTLEDYSRYGAGMIEADCTSTDWVDQAPHNNVSLPNK